MYGATKFNMSKHLKQKSKPFWDSMNSLLNMADTAQESLAGITNTHPNSITRAFLYVILKSSVLTLSQRIDSLKVI